MGRPLCFKASMRIQLYKCLALSSFIEFIKVIQQQKSNSCWCNLIFDILHIGICKYDVVHISHSRTLTILLVYLNMYMSSHLFLIQAVNLFYPGMDYLHSQSVLHTDLKGSSVLLDHYLDVKVINLIVV